MSEVNNKILKAHEDETSGALVAEFVDATMPGSLEELAAQVGELDTEINAETTGLAAKVSALEEVVPELPAVTAGDNGKVLGVSSGAWAAITTSSEFAIFDVGYNINDNPIVPRLLNNKTIEDLVAAMNADKCVILRGRLGGTANDALFIYSGLAALNESVDTAMMFTSLYPCYDLIVEGAMALSVRAIAFDSLGSGSDGTFISFRVTTT